MEKKLLAIIIFGVIIMTFIAITGLMLHESSVDSDMTSPYIVTGIKIVSTAKGVTKEGTVLWNLNLVQENDIYVDIEKNITYEHNEKIKKLYINETEIDVNSRRLNTGGTIEYKHSNTEVGEYISNDETEIKQDGTLLKKAGITLEKIKKEISFDIILVTESNKKYKATVTQTVPVEGLVDAGIGTEEKNNVNDIVFKRI